MHHTGLKVHGGADKSFILPGNNDCPQAPVSNIQSPVSNPQSSICNLPTADCRLPIAYCRLYLENFIVRFTRII
ncbi:hypothetical protein KsCSTR_22360 [Candidatus Kuenenia stuttgartiensis]|uniref:Uncharacterized protein n=1 Tax=Kuenenia stuttgartiensis TaxID=174633 RepID=Q1Q3C6_KUEST|nr:hypothetical protein KsCSTR_22360 [Candidatus Kuenenia stuttgartiensis]CAJ74515.1 unknown protein [Candidatus Kuenenia stuttgartiensis]